MSEFVMDHMIQIWLAIAAISIAGMYLTAKRLPPGWQWSTLLAIIVVPFTILVGSVVSLATVALWSPSAVSALTNDIGAGVAYLFETGIEYAAPVLLISSVSAAVFRLRRNA